MIALICNDDSRTAAWYDPNKTLVS